MFQPQDALFLLAAEKLGLVVLIREEKEQAMDCVAKHALKIREESVLADIAEARESVACAVEPYLYGCVTDLQRQIERAARVRNTYAAPRESLATLVTDHVRHAVESLAAAPGTTAS